MAAKIYIVDDDDSVRQGLTLLFNAANYDTETFATPDAFLKFVLSRPEAPACIVLDHKMPGMTGLELQGRLIANGVTLPIIFLSGHGNIPTAVQAIQDGAVDFLEKPFNSEVLLERAQDAIERYKHDLADRQHTDERLQRLTHRETEVLDLIVAGKPNKVIALDLGISERTVELHRAHIMEKMQVRNLAHLLRVILPLRQ